MLFFDIVERKMLLPVWHGMGVVCLFSFSLFPSLRLLPILNPVPPQDQEQSKITEENKSKKRKKPILWCVRTLCSLSYKWRMEKKKERENEEKKKVLSVRSTGWISINRTPDGQHGCIPIPHSPFPYPSPSRHAAIGDVTDKKGSRRGGEHLNK